MYSSRRRQIARRCRRLRISTPTNRRVHVRLDLRRRQGYVVDSHFVDDAVEILPIEAVAPDL
jgi:hypothetical protein